MSVDADVLRRAAALMRERAEAATPGPWEQMTNYGLLSNAANVHTTPDRTTPGWTACCEGPLVGGTAADDEKRWANAAHIASWHPAVALAVADWLLFEAGRWAADHERHWLQMVTAWNRANNEPMPRDAHAHFKRTSEEYANGLHDDALAVARAYLGESA